MEGWAKRREGRQAKENNAFGQPNNGEGLKP
ncbi:Uncharacterised protein [Paenibacillus thiaminolyticus]|nr:Uncharacterised protein [Paenibacillus thiaminolyticus]